MAETDGYRFLDGAVHFPDQGVLAMADLHLGYEAELRARGVHVPSSEFPVLLQRIERLLENTTPRTIIINGDFKHAFGRISDAEWRQARRLLELLVSNAERTILVSGNHDPLLGPLAGIGNLDVVPSYRIGGLLFLHGDREPSTEELEGVHTIIIGHEHPAIIVGDGARTEKVKAYLVGEWKGLALIVLPSMFSLTEGTDVLRAPLQSPLLQDIGSFRCYALSEGETLFFGTVAELRRRKQ